MLARRQGFSEFGLVALLELNERIDFRVRELEPLNATFHRPDQFLRACVGGQPDPRLLLLWRRFFLHWVWSSLVQEKDERAIL